jgi:site-specific DNA-methyltransferase (adenine-specific)
MRPTHVPSEHSALLNTVLVGDSCVIAQQLPSQFANAIITSPPYFGHRQYAADESLVQLEIGREASLSEYVERLVKLFGALRRVLRDDGTLWLNLGDTYREGQLLGVPWRVAFALQADGWLLRSEIIWHKPNAMPSSVKNRPTTAHETVFMFAKQANYYYDADAIREPHVTFTEQSRMKGGRNHFGKRDGTPENGKNRGNANLHRARWDQAFHPMGRNKRTVWNIPLGKFRGAHFAVFPEELVETCLLASTPEQGVVLDPFMGSGTTGVVAKRLNRNFLGIELVPYYAHMALQRIAQADKALF